jgi:tetratricopeptide (TPR) repeat protein
MLPTPVAQPADPPAAEPRSGERGWWPPVLLVALGLLAYANAFGGAMVFDDLQQIRVNPLVRDLSAMASWDGYRVLPSRWIAYLTFALNHSVGGLAPAGYHAVNVAIHLGTALLLYALVRVTFRTPRLRESALAPHASAVAFLAAALFVAHPIQTQAVTYIVQRIASLAALFYVGAVLLYARWRLAPPRAGRTGRAVRYAGVVVLALLAAHTKEIAITLPLAIALYELCFFDPEPGRRGRWLWLLPLLAVAALVPLLRVPAGHPLGPAGLALVTRDLQSHASRLDYFLTQGPVLVRYLLLLVLPVGQSLDHDVRLQRSPLAPEVAAAGLALVSLMILALVLARRARPGAPHRLDPAARLAAFGIAWWFLTHAVESSIFPITDLMNEHRVYLPSAGAFAAAAVGLAWLARRRVGPERASRAVMAAGAALGIVLSGATLARNTVWRNEVTLWTDAARKAPAKLRPALNAGTALAQAGRYREAEASLRHAAILDPKSAFAHAQLAAVLLSLRRPAEAEPELRRALQLAPSDVEATFNLAILLHETGRTAEAREWFTRFLAIAPARYAGARKLAEARSRP